MRRKTIRVGDVLGIGNEMLRRSDDSMVEFRKGVASLLESVLMQSDAYSGFGYLTDADCSGLPGIRFYDGVTGAPLTPSEARDSRVNGESVKTEFPDETRRVYYRA